MIGKIVWSIGAGLVVALKGYGKTEGEDFDIPKFMTTCVIGAGAGLFMGIADVPISDGLAFFINLGVVPVIEDSIKIAVRKVIPWLKKFLGISD